MIEKDIPLSERDLEHACGGSAQAIGCRSAINKKQASFFQDRKYLIKLARFRCQF